jgi:hypothetical protein
LSFSIEKRFLAALIALAAVLSFGVLVGTAEAKKPKPVSVFPAPKTPVASDETTFSFRGLKPRNLGKVKIFGSKSGQHGYTRLRHSDGKGVSIVPKKSFVPGEKVKVYTKKRIKLTNKGDFWVRIGNFYGNDDSEAGPGKPPATDGLKSRPDLKPTKLDVSVNTPEASPDKVFYAPKIGGLTIANNAGQVRWFRPAGYGGTGSQVYNFQATQLNGRPVLTYWKGASSATGFSQVGAYEILNNKYNKIATVTPGNGYGANIHEFELTAHNTALVQAYRGVKWDMTSVGGPSDGKILDNVVQEIDIKTGAVLFEWHALGSVGLKASEGPIPNDGSAWDYLHINATKADGDSILISGRRMSTIYRVNRSTAKVRWRLRGDGIKPKTNNFNVPEDARFGYQHDMERLPNGNISLFDNGSDRPQNGLPVISEESNALILELSGKGDNRTATAVKRYTHEPDPIVAQSQGSARLLENGNWFVGWGQVLAMTEFAPDGEVVWDATFPVSGTPSNSYRAFKAPWVGYPKDRPAIASEADGGGAKVYASWNGSTKVQSWKVFTGTSEDSLTEVGSSPWKGLETEIAISSVNGSVQAVAYDGDGKEIGKSGLIPLGQQSR